VEVKMGEAWFSPEEISAFILGKLKADAEVLIKKGFYVSFSDLVRHSIRELVSINRYDRWAAEAKEDLKKGRAVVLRNEKEIDEYMNSIR